MTEKNDYDRFTPVYESIRKNIKKFPTSMFKKDVFMLAESLGIKVWPYEVRLLLDGLERYFRKFEIIATETEVLAGEMKGEHVIRFEKMSEGEEKYVVYFDVYKSLGQALNEYISKYDEYVIDINNIITYANKMIPKDIKKVPTGEFFLKGLEQYLGDRADLYLPPEAKRGGIEMEIKPLISMETGKRIGNVAVFREIR